MKALLTVCTLAALVVPASTMLTQAQAQSPETGFTALFNGRDFTDWRLANPDSFELEDGAIVANGSAGPGHAFYDGAVESHLFRHFELRADVMTRPDANGGIYVLTEYQERGWPAKGFEVQVSNSYPRDPVRTGSLYHVSDITTAPASDDEWFTMAIVVREMTITVQVNGQETVTWTQPPDWQGTFTRSGRPEFPERRIQPGTIALQAHDPNSRVYYKNIRIRPFAATPPPVWQHPGVR